MKKPRFWLIILLVIVILILVKLRGNEDDRICENGSRIEHGHPSMPMPSTGCEKILETGNVSVLSGTNQTMEKMIISSVFEDGQMMPALYTCQGKNINPPIELGNIPQGTLSLALTMDDPDAPGGNWDHWIMWNIPVVNNIEEGNIPEGAVLGKNGWGETKYSGPCPPNGTHRYIFNIYALDIVLKLKEGSNKKDLINAMSGHIINQSKLMGLYKKSIN